VQYRWGYLLFYIASRSSLALAPQLLLLLFTDLLVDLGALAGLVAVRAGRQRSIFAAALLIDGDIFFLVLALLLAGELVLDGALVLCDDVSVDSYYFKRVVDIGKFKSLWREQWNKGGILGSLAW
jgi:hypothetical protein